MLVTELKKEMFDPESKGFRLEDREMSVAIHMGAGLHFYLVKI